MSDLGALRDEIDAIDRQILELFEKRTAVSRGSGNVKREHGLEVFDEAREEAKLAQVYAQAGYESRPYVRELWDRHGSGKAASGQTGIRRSGTNAQAHILTGNT